MATAPKPLDYAAYLKTPETMRRYDIVDGAMIFMSPSPDAPNQETSGEIYTLLKRHVERHRSGEVYYAPLDVFISKSPLCARQPDVLYISNSRLGLIDGPIHGGPDLVVEILSPGNGPAQVQQKLRDYAAAGVREAWLLDRNRKTITVLHPVKGEFRETAVFGVTQRLRSKVLPRLALPVRKVFAP